ncbi:MAG: DUF6783 domain-containing protein [Anaerobutyricum hallii]
MKVKYTANWGVQIAGMIFQTHSRFCCKFTINYQTGISNNRERKCS